MSNRYKTSGEVPSDVLCKRLDELSDAVTKNAVNREFVMRIPAEVDYDADIVLSEASIRIKDLESKNEWSPQTPLIPGIYLAKYEDAGGIHTEPVELRCHSDMMDEWEVSILDGVRRLDSSEILSWGRRIDIQESGE